MKNGARPAIAAVPRGHEVKPPHQMPAPEHMPGMGGALPENVPTADKADLLDGSQAFGLWLLLERPPLNDEKSAGGIILPDAVRERPSWIVRSKGEKVTIPVEVGDHVVFDGTRIMKDAKSGRAWCFAMEGQIMGRLDPRKLANRIITQTAGI